MNIFLFHNEKLEQLAFMRIVLFGTLFYIDSWRLLLVSHYQSNSMIPRELALRLYPDFYRGSFEYFFWSDSWALPMHVLLLVLLLMGFLGLSNRFLMLLTWVIYQGFLQRNYAIQFGADLIGGLFLFFISWTYCCEKWSLKNLIFKSRFQFQPQRFLDQVSSVVFRIMQIQISVIYAYTGFEKLKGNSWWDGTALWTVFANPQFTVLDFTWLQNFPLFFAIGTFTTVIFEIYFPTMMLFRKTRLPWLALGVIFHFLIGTTLGLMPFSLVMISTYFLFLERSDLIRIHNFLFKRFKRVQF